MKVFAILGLLVAMAIAQREADRILYFYTGYHADATDAASGRSGVARRVDHGTGCEYLESRGGGLAPRLDAAGRHICASR